MTSHKVSFVLLCALVMSSSALAKSTTRQATEAKKYAKQKGIINGEIALAEQTLHHKNFKVNDTKHRLEMAQQEVRDAIQNVNRAKEEEKQLDTWFNNLPARSGENNQITEAHSYAVRKESIDNKIVDQERTLQDKEFRIQDIARHLEMAKQEQHDATRELEIANNRLKELDHWFKALPR